MEFQVLRKGLGAAKESLLNYRVPHTPFEKLVNYTVRSDKYKNIYVKLKTKIKTNTHGTFTRHRHTILPVLQKPPLWCPLIYITCGNSGKPFPPKPA